MARYYFNVRHKPGREGLARDPDGDEIADVALVRGRAVEMASDLITRTRLDSIPNWFDCSFEIADEQGCAIMIVPFGSAIATNVDELEGL